MILEVDAGNTRIKWRLMREAEDAALVKEAEGVVLAEKKTPSVFMDMSLQFDALSLDKVRRMKVSSVRGEGFQEVFSSVMTERWGLRPEFSIVEATCGGVSNSYSNAEAMGVDRWLAMLAAYKDAGGACCVVDCGSALTLDLVNEQGQHQGGYIVPGLNLMQSALAGKSEALGFSDGQWGMTSLGADTKAAVNNGILSMTLGLLERVRSQSMGNNLASMQWYVTGGDAGIVSPLLAWPHKLVPGLVMDGLSISLP